MAAVTTDRICIRSTCSAPNNNGHGFRGACAGAGGLRAGYAGLARERRRIELYLARRWRVVFFLPKDFTFVGSPAGV
jgi:hypothetical protein